MRIENEVALSGAELIVVRQMCDVKLSDKATRVELREREAVLLCNKLQWHGYVLQKNDREWVKKYMDFVLEGTRPRGRPTETWKEVVEGGYEKYEDI